MDNKNLIAQPENQLSVKMPEWAGAMFEQMNQSMRLMAEAIKATNENMDMLKRQMQQMVPLTAGQANAVNKQIRGRAAELREQYRLAPSADGPIAAAIRKDVRLSAGVRSVAELPRSLYQVYAEQVALWDNYAAMKEIKKKHREG